MSLNRRQFLTGATATLLSACVKKAEHNDLAEIFQGISLKDQYGKEIDAAAIVGEKPCLVVFGFNDCSMCGTINAEEQRKREGISATVAATQQELLKKGIDASVIVVSVKPEEDQFAMAPYTASYYAAGVRQLANEPLVGNTGKMLEAYENASKADASQRLLHIVTPPTGAKANEIAGRINALIDEANKQGGKKTERLLYNAEDPSLHTPRMTLFANGKLVGTFSTLAADEKHTPLKGAAAQKVLSAIAGNSELRQDL